MDDVVAGLTTKSDKIRALANAGYKRSEIANYVGVRYQFVRNVLVDDARRAGFRQTTAAPAGLAEDAKPFVDAPAPDPRRAVRLDVSADGTLTLPNSLLVAVGLQGGGVLLARFDDDEIRLMTPEVTARKVQAAVRKYVPDGVSLVDELIKERRREVAREQGDA